MAGLDPAIHASKPQERTVDARVKPAHDEIGVSDRRKDLERHRFEWNHLESSNLVIPAKAGIQGKQRAFALDPRFRGGDGRVSI